MKGLFESNVPNYSLKRGKVRDVYDLGTTMLIIVTTDRISAYDWVIPNTVIPQKGQVLTGMSKYWAETLDVYYHLISTNLKHMPEGFQIPELEGRTMLVEKAEVMPFECVVRGYLSGSAWKDYKKTGSVCGIRLPGGLKENQQFPKPLFTPATKSPTGHDENISFEYMSSQLGMEVAAELEAMSIQLYMDAAEHAWNNGIIIADTKFEWGVLPHAENEIVLIDEILTADSSRYWPLDAYELGASIPSLDKQGVRDWLAAQKDFSPDAPQQALPEEVIQQTTQKYLDIYQRIVGKPLEEGNNV